MARERPLSERVRDTIALSRMLREQTAELRKASRELLERRARMRLLDAMEESARRDAGESDAPR